MSALLASEGFLSLQEYFGMSVSTFVHHNKTHLRMKEDRGKESSREREKGWMKDIGEKKGFRGYTD